MTHFIRDQKNNTLAEVDEVRSQDFPEELDFRVSVDIREFANKLLAVPENDREAFIVDFDHFSQLRGTWWEVVKPYDDRYTDDTDGLRHFIRDCCLAICDHWGFAYVTD